MPSTFTIPATSVAVGTTTFGPANIPDADNGVSLIIDRTASKGNVQGFNSLTNVTQMNVQIDQSNDGGNTWQNLAAMGPIIGGIFTSDKTGTTQTITQERLSTEFNPGTGRMVRAIVNESGTSVAISGSITSF